jgi:hypothetical protein
MSNTLQLATRKNVIQMSSDVITNCYCNMFTSEQNIFIVQCYFRNDESSYSTPLVFEEFQQKFPHFQGTYSGE